MNYALSPSTRRAILIAACAAEGVVCTREVPVLLRVAIATRDGARAIGQFEVMEGAEPADAFYRFCRVHSEVDGEHCAALLPQVLEAACAVTPCSRRRAVVYNSAIVLDGANLGVLTLHHDEEAADLVHALCARGGVDAARCAPIIAELCDQHAYCSRRRPRVWASPVAGEAPGAGVVGTIELWADEEPADAAHVFCAAHGLGPSTRRAILVAACAAEGVRCTRELPVVFRVNIAARDAHIGVAGEFTVLENEEPADAFYRFCRAQPLAAVDGAHCAALMAPVLEEACAAAPCTRRRARAYDNGIVIDGEEVGRLTLWHDDEPADAVFDFCGQAGLSDATCAPIVAQLCARHVYCRRNRPLLAEQLISAPGRGVIGTVEVLGGDEAADIVHAFFVANSLPRAWSEGSIVEALCIKLSLRAAGGAERGAHGAVSSVESSVASSAVPGCTRWRALAVELTVAGGDGAPLDAPLRVWGDEEGADAVWRFISVEGRARRIVSAHSDLLAALDGGTLSGTQQRALLLQSRALRDVHYTLLAAVCKRPLVQCSRAAPLVFSMAVARGRAALPPHAATTHGAAQAPAAVGDAPVAVRRRAAAPTCVTVRGGWRWVAGAIFAPDVDGAWLPNAALALFEAARAPAQAFALASPAIAVATAHPLAEVAACALASLVLFVVLSAIARRRYAALRLRAVAPRLDEPTAVEATVGGSNAAPACVAETRELPLPSPRSRARAEAGVRFVKSPAIAQLRVDTSPEPRDDDSAVGTPAGQETSGNVTPQRGVARAILSRVEILACSPSTAELHRAAGPLPCSRAAYVEGWDFGTIPATPEMAQQRAGDRGADGSGEMEEADAGYETGDDASPVWRRAATPRPPRSIATPVATPRSVSPSADSAADVAEDVAEVPDAVRAPAPALLRGTRRYRDVARRLRIFVALTVVPAAFALIGGCCAGGVIAVTLLQPIDGIDRAMHDASVVAKPLEIYAWEEAADALVTWMAHKDVAKHHLLLDYDGVGPLAEDGEVGVFASGFRPRAGSAGGVAAQLKTRYDRRARRTAARAVQRKRNADARAAGEAEAAARAALLAQWQREDSDDAMRAAAAAAAATSAAMAPEELAASKAATEAKSATRREERAREEREFRATWAKKRDVFAAAELAAGAAERTARDRTTATARKEARKRRWRDIARSALFEELLDGVCSDDAHPAVLCTRRAPMELVETLTVTQYGVSHDAVLRRPPLRTRDEGTVAAPPAFAALRVDSVPRCVAPAKHYRTHAHETERGAERLPAIAEHADLTHLCAARAAVDLCARMRPPPAGCHQSLFDAVRASYDAAETRRWSGKTPDPCVPRRGATSRLPPPGPRTRTN
jgi:hypothetical protein